MSLDPDRHQFPWNPRLRRQEKGRQPGGLWIITEPEWSKGNSRRKHDYVVGARDVEDMVERGRLN